MQKLISELTRLYLPADAPSAASLAQHMLGQSSRGISLSTADGLTRGIVIAFDKMVEREEAEHWSRLCEVAHALQAQLGLPAPAVSISGANGYALWLSLATPTPVAEVQQFLELLRVAYFPDMPLRPDAASAAVELPPCLHQGTGRWAAFIHPGLGASFADESGLEMAPPFAAQSAFLEGLHSIGAAQFLHAVQTLRHLHGTAPASASASAVSVAPLGAPSAERASAPDGLLLRDATLEDIVRFLHAKNIEPTFRHLLAQ
ncbi:hypothetical protein ACFOLJ_25330 [Rugamonas sp. CCM 8940]|uniref:hypothetical protein n=1 Tax=Rugamonas sp. CCM 8940 TaxID=2765359 RepID=UPI0018F6A828|nr:hypothetical protein [Rugamonas sp. CCM 8940]MBJ7310885.1 hypothetical protein [Rugamonas sp. CCM 8940]